MAIVGIEADAATILRADWDHPGTSYGSALLLVSQDAGASWTRSELPYVPYYTTDIPVGYLSTTSPSMVAFDMHGRIHVVGEAQAQYAAPSGRYVNPSVGFHMWSDNLGQEWTLAGRFGKDHVESESTSIVDLGEGRLAILWTEESLAFAASSVDRGSSWNQTEAEPALECPSIAALATTSSGALAVCRSGSPHLIEYSLATSRLEDRGYPLGSAADPECSAFGLAAKREEAYLFGASCRPAVQLYSPDAGLTWQVRAGYDLGIPSVSPRVLDAEVDQEGRFHIVYEDSGLATHTILSRTGTAVLQALRVNLGACESLTTAFLGMRGFGFALADDEGFAAWGCEGLSVASVTWPRVAMPA